MRPRQKRVAVFGSVGINRGDDLMNRVLVNFFSEHGYVVESASMRPERMKSIYGDNYFSHRLRNFRHWTRIIRDSDLVIIGGGTVVQDDFRKVIGGILTYTAVVILVSKLFGKKVHAISIGINRIRRLESILFFNAYRLVDSVYVRDGISEKLARQITWLSGKIHSIPDLAFLRRSYGHVSAQSRADGEGERLLISLVGETHRKSSEVILKAAYAVSRQCGVPLVGIAMDERTSEEISVFGSFKAEHPDFDYVIPETAEEAVAQIQNAMGVVAMRLHACIVSLVMHIPLVAVSREAKTDWIREWIPDGMFLRVEECEGQALQVAIEKLIRGGEKVRLPNTIERVAASAAMVENTLKRFI